MFDLESQISSWRQSFAQQKLDESTLAELESHLRDLFANLRRGGATDEQAWEQAMAGLGDAKGIAMEFRKSPQVVWWPTLFAVGLVSTCGAAVLALMLKRGIHGATDQLLLAHVTTITVGYTAMFATGLLAICSVLQRTVKRWDPQREAALRKYTLILSMLAVPTVTLGILLGSLWTLKTRNVFWNRDPREIGGALVWVWAICQVEIFHRPGLSPAFRLTAGFVANLVTALAWFGPVILDLRHAYGSDGITPTLAGFIGLNVLLALLAWWLPQTNGRDVESIKAD